MCETCEKPKSLKEIARRAEPAPLKEGDAQAILDRMLLVLWDALHFDREPTRRPHLGDREIFRGRVGREQQGGSFHGSVRHVRRSVVWTRRRQAEQLQVRTAHRQEWQSRLHR